MLNKQIRVIGIFNLNVFFMKQVALVFEVSITILANGSARLVID